MDNPFRRYISIIENYEEFEWAGINMSGAESNSIMQRIWKSKYPQQKLYVDGADIDQPFWYTDPNAQNTGTDFYFATRGNEITNETGGIVSVDEAYSGQFKGVIKPYINQCFIFMERKWKQEYPEQPVPGRKLVLYSRDGSGGVWSSIASSLGAELTDDPSH
jgi:hypothetical protein